MDIKNPEYILEIARQQSVTHAAEKLFVTQSTPEPVPSEAGKRAGNAPCSSGKKTGLVPTEAGQVYLQAARAVVEVQNAAAASIAALKKEGFLCVGGLLLGADAGDRSAAGLQGPVSGHYPAAVCG